MYVGYAVGVASAVCVASDDAGVPVAVIVGVWIGGNEVEVAVGMVSGLAKGFGRTPRNISAATTATMAASRRINPHPTIGKMVPRPRDPPFGGGTG